VLTRIPDSWRWARLDIVIRLVPFAIVYAAAYRLSGGARWLGWSTGDLAAQLVFALVGIPVMFVAATAVQLWLTRRRGSLSVPAGLDDAAFQAGFYVVNGPIEEAFFRGLVQGGLGALWAAPVGFLAGTLAYVLYHRLGAWSWSETFATALVGVPLGLAFWLLPGPPSLLGVSLVHIAATCGFLGPGPYLLSRLRLL
jgi:membrane protease YdiL (CAAX protease family)